MSQRLSFRLSQEESQSEEEMRNITMVVIFLSDGTISDYGGPVPLEQEFESGDVIEEFDRGDDFGYELAVILGCGVSFEEAVNSSRNYYRWLQAKHSNGASAVIVGGHDLSQSQHFCDMND